jgi:hypothetical protein
MAEPATYPESVCGAILDADAGASLTLGTDLFEGPQRPPSSLIPHAVTFVIATGGPVNAPYMNDSQDHRVNTIQVLTRGSVGDYDGALAQARASRAALHRADLASYPGYFGIVVREPDPVFLGFDDTEHPRFTFNVQLSYSG